MQEHIILGLMAVIALGVLAQWVAMQLKMPSILFLLVFGCLAGPVTGFINPDYIFGDLLFPVVSLSVAIILFEGGSDLKLSELREIGKVVLNMTTISVLTAGALITAAAYLLLDLRFNTSALLGAMLIVTGPTVIGPLLRHMRPSAKVGNIVKWEGIMNDPIGVIIAVLVFETILSHNIQEAGLLVFGGIFKTLLIAIVISVVFSFFLVFLLRRYLIQDSLHQVFTLMLVITAFVLSNLVQHESGLLTVTLMGIILANQKKVSIKHIIEFKEHLRILIICTLFIILSARLRIADLKMIDGKSLIFVGVLIFLVRPISVWVSTMKTELNWKEKLFIAWMAPRGIVAAAMASIFAHDLMIAGHPDAGRIVPITFLVIISTVTVYGITSTPLAHYLGLAKTNPQGTLIVGAHRWSRIMAKAIAQKGLKVILVDSNAYNISEARKEGLTAYNENIFNEGVFDKINLEDIGRIFCVTSNDEANSLASVRFKSEFGSANIYQLYPEHLESMSEASSQEFHGRFLFGQNINFATLSSNILQSGSFQEYPVEEGFDLEAVKLKFNVVPMFLFRKNGNLHIFTDDTDPQFENGDVILSLKLK